MRCPKCNSKLINEECRYCKITKNQISNASHKKAVNLLKQHQKDNIYYSNVIPKDLNKIALILFTIFGGIFGLNSLYIHNYAKGFFCLIGTSLSIILYSFDFIKLFGTGTFGIIINNLATIGLFILVITLFFWMSDIVSIIFKQYRVPVVLGEK